MQYRNRYYDAGLGRFISRDPVLSQNLYQMVGGRPGTAIDPYGLNGTNIWDYQGNGQPLIVFGPPPDPYGPDGPYYCGPQMHMPHVEPPAPTPSHPSHFPTLNKWVRCRKLLTKDQLLTYADATRDACNEV
jgi:hypothetical protein